MQDVSHEINTPLGAIRSSIENIASFLTQNLEQLPGFFQYLWQERKQGLFVLLQTSMQQPFLIYTKQQ